MLGEDVTSSSKTTKKNESPEWRRNRRRLQWALPAVLAIIPISQASSYGVVHGYVPSWFYGSPLFYCFIVMIAIFASFHEKAVGGTYTEYRLGKASSGGRRHSIQNALAITLALWSVLIPMLREIKLHDQALMQMLHYLQTIMDAGFIFLVLISVIDLCSGIFFDAASDIDEDEIAIRRAHAVKIGYFTALLSLIALYAVTVFLPVWTARMLSPLTALSLVFPMMTLAQPVADDNIGERPHAAKIGFATAVLSLGTLYLASLIQPTWTILLLPPAIGLSLAFPFMALLHKPKPQRVHHG